MGVITTSAHPKDLWPGIVAHFGHTYTEHQEEFSQIFDKEDSTKAYEERVQYTGLGLAAVKGQGAPIGYDESQQGYISRMTNVTYAIGAIVTREAIDDGQYESIAKRLSKGMAFSLRQTKENIGANILNRAFTSGYNGGDGVSLINSAHPETGGNQSNHIATAADLSEASLEDLLIQIMQAQNARGLKISLVGQKLIVPPALVFEATRILKSALQSGNANNDVNALKQMGLLPGGIVVNHYLTDADAWFVKTNAPEGLIYQERRSYEFKQDNDFDTENAKMKASERYTFGWADFRAVYGSPGA